MTEEILWRHPLLKEIEKLKADHLAALAEKDEIIENHVFKKDEYNKKLLDENIDYQNENATQRNQIAALKAENDCLKKQIVRHKEDAESRAGRIKELTEALKNIVMTGKLSWSTKEQLVKIAKVALEVK
jgi:ribosomal protein L4